MCAMIALNTTAPDSSFWPLVAPLPHFATNMTNHVPRFAVVEAQNALTNSVLERCSTREKFKDLMTRLYNYERFSCPFKRGTRCALVCSVCGVADCMSA